MALFFIFRYTGPCTNMLLVMQILTGVPPLSVAAVLEVRLYKRKFFSSFMRNEINLQPLNDSSTNIEM